jgi:hypothetical protein
MKRWKALVMLCAAVLMPLVSWENPIIQRPCSEFMFTSTGWIMEMSPLGPQTYDNWSLTSKVDTAYFKDGIKGSPFLVITPDSLKSRFLVGHAWDRIAIRNQNMEERGYITYGNVQYSDIAAPTTSRSIAYNLSFNFFYLDNSPTFGFENDSLNAVGIVEGVVTDSAGVPIRDVQIGNWEWPVWISTDSSGHFAFTDFARRLTLGFSHPAYNPVAMSFQVWPESTLHLTIMMDPVVSVTQWVGNDVPSAFKLRQNYPNPFNPSTTLELWIPTAEMVALIIYDMQGEEIATLVSGRLEPGTYRVRWNPGALATGVYFCRMTAGRYQETRKMVMVR